MATMEIKEDLKRIDVKISSLASGLRISRPTLDYYIRCYEEGVKLPNDSYQKIFDYLFQNSGLSAVEFAQKYDYVKKTMLPGPESRPEEVGAQQNPSGDLANAIYSKLAGQNNDVRLLEFINLLLSNQDSPLVQALFSYFAISNGFVILSSENVSEKDKAFYSQIAKLFASYQDGTIKLDGKRYQKLIGDNAKLYGKKHPEAANEALEYIKAHADEPDKIDIDYLKTLLNNQEGKKHGSK
jgi:hypothetical protein